jgi:G3E family GTPase
MLPLTILGGYLGAGKTTLINRLLAKPPAAFKGKRLTILVNDFGAINIDAALIEAHEGETISLANGCACCQLQDDALNQLQQLAQSDTPPDHVLIEASGAGEPARLAYLGYGIPGFQLAGIAC